VGLIVILIICVVKVIGDAISQLIKSFGDIIKTVIEFLANLLTKLAELLMSLFGGGLLGGIGDFLGNGLKGVGELLSGLGSGLGNAFTGLANLSGESGGSLLDGIKGLFGADVPNDSNFKPFEMQSLSLNMEMSDIFPTFIAFVILIIFLYYFCKFVWRLIWFVIAKCMSIGCCCARKVLTCGLC
jgi:hypothetical protein